MTYEFNGKQYKKASTHQTSWGGKMAEMLPLKGSERILDIGCGDGRVTQKLASRVPDGEVLGIDASSGMIAAAKQYESANLHFEVVDVTELDFHEQFDVVFSHAALHWVRDHAVLWQKVHEVLRVGGYARLNFAGNGTCPTLIKVLREVMEQAPYAKYFKNFTWPWYMPSATDYRKLLTQSPFREVEVREEPMERLFPTDDPLIKWIDHPCLVPFLAAVAESDKQGFRDLVIERMIDKTRQPAGGFLEMFCRIDVFAKK